MIRLLRSLLVALVAFGGACDPPPDRQQWASVKRGSLVVGVEVSGTLRAVESTRIGPPGIPRVWNFKLAMMHPEGAEVAQDDPVLAFDTSELKQRLDEKVAERDSAATQLATTRAELQVTAQDLGLEQSAAKGELRKAKLKAEAPQDITAQIELQKLALDLKLAKRRVKYLERKIRSSRQKSEADISRLRSIFERAEARVKQIGTAIDQMTVKAPKAGTVIYETNWRGEKKKVGDSTWRGETVLRLVSLEQMEAAGEIDEVDANRVTTGHVVSLRLDAQPDVELRGRIREISRTVQRQSPDNPLKIIRIKIALEDTEGARLRPGMRFRGRVETERVDDVLLVPLEAIETTDGGPVAHRRTATGVEQVPVTLGRRNKDQVEVTEGLSEGDEIVGSQGRRAREAGV